MTLLQAALIGLFGYLGEKRTPWFFGCTGGWYTLGRPLVAGLVIGLILGDVKSGILAGAAIQALYMGLVTPAGTLPADINLAAYIGIPLAVVSGKGADYAVAIAVPMSFIGILVFNLIMTLDSIFAHKADKYAELGDGNGVRRMNLVATLLTLFIKGGIIFAACYLGAPVAQAMASSLPQVVTNIFVALGHILPALGFALLLMHSVKGNKKMIVFFLIGYIVTASFNITILSLAILGICIAMLDVAYKNADNNEKSGIMSNSSK